MGENWNKKRSVEESKPQWSVIIALLVLLLLPIIGAVALYYSFTQEASSLMLFSIAGLCLFSMALPLMALYYLRKNS
jgi:hypothetical protein